MSSSRVDVEEATLADIGDIPVDDILAVIDGEVPDYRTLYYRWERHQWEAGSIDFGEDARQWGREFSDAQRRSLLWGSSSFYVGGEQATSTLVPFVDAMPGEEAQVFITTQLVDEARHTVFFDRFYSEALGEQGDDMESRVDRQADRLGDGFRKLLLEMLPAASERVRREPGNPDALVEGIVLHHIVIEGTVALSGQRFMLNHLREANLLPGFRAGFTAVARDESRHVGFGLRFLKEAVDSDPRCADVIRNYLESVTPIGMTVVEPPGGDMTYYDPLPYGPEDLTSFALDALSKRLRAIGITV